MFTDESPYFPPGMEPAMIIQSFDAALNARDVERVLKFFTPDAIVRFMYPPPFPEPDTYTGQDEVRQLLRGYLTGKFQISSHDYQMSGDKITWRYHLIADRFRELGLDEVDGSAGAAFLHGKIQHFTLSFSPDATARIEEGLDRAGIPGPISEALARGVEDAAAGSDQAEDLPGDRPHRGPTWDPAGADDHQPPPR